MFSIKQYVINLTSEARKELRNLIDEIEKNAPKAEVLVVEEAPAPTKTKAKAAEAEAPATE